MPARFWVLLFAAALATGGLALGAATQEERILVTQLGDGAAGGNLVVLTAPLLALGAVMAGWTLRNRNLPAILPLLALFVSVLLGVMLVQGAGGLHKIELRDDSGRSQAAMSINPFIHNGAGIASVLIPVFGLVTAGLMLAEWGLQGIWGGPTADHPRHVLRRLVAANAVAVPFLIVAATGAVEILLAAPANTVGVGPYYVVLPAIVLVALGLLVTSAVRVWNLFACVRNPRLLDLSAEVWRGVGRADAILVAVGAIIALASSALAKLEPEGLTVGATLAVTTRSHNQFLILLGVALIPLWRVHRAGARTLARAPVTQGTLDAHGADPFLVGWVASLVVAVVAAPLAAFTLDGALWPWLAAFLPMALWAVRFGDARESAVPLILLALVLWGIGNTVSASFDTLGEAILQYHVAPGVLALWRLLGATVMGVVAVRIAGLIAAPMAPSLRWPLSIGLGLCISVLMMLEMPFSIWIINTPRGAEVGIGSIVAAQEPNVRMLMHTLAMAVGVVAGLLLARLRHPAWFRRTPPATPMPVDA